eukprot:XP_019922114.1 PREDICTED: caprin-2 [Crassostrea gigas]
MACFLLLSVFSLCLFTRPTASKGDDRVDKMEDRLWKLEEKLNQYIQENGHLKTMERKLNKYMEEHGRLLQQNQKLQRRVSKTEKKNGELTIKISSLEEKVKEIQQSNDKCQMDIKQLSIIIEDNSDSFIFNNDQMNGSTPSNSNEVKSFSSHTYIRKRIVPATVASTEQVAFYAYMSTNTPANLRQHHTLIYDVVKINKGQGYHQDDGIFTVPSSGVYVFTWTVAVKSYGWASTELVINGVVFGATYAHGESRDWDHSSGNVVVETHTADHVYIRMQENGMDVVVSNERGRSSFSGWKLF